MVSVSPVSGPSGLTMKTEEVLLTCTDALALGDVVMLTLASGGYTACTKSATADFTPDHIIGVALEAVTAGAIGRIAVKGTLQVARHDTGAAGLTAVVGGAAGRLTAGPTNPHDTPAAYIKMVGVFLTTAAGSPTAGELATVLFDGINGIGAATDD